MAYQILAGYYDDLVKDDQAAERWASWVRQWMDSGRFLELACGSGEITRRLSQFLDVRALDLSADMLEHAAKKPGMEKVALECRNMLDLSGMDTYQGIGCFCDSFNYLSEPEEVQTFFKECADHLEENGVLLFDMHAFSRLDEFAEGYEECGTFADGTQLQWVIQSEDDLLYQDFAFYTDKGLVCEHHLQRVYTLEQIRSWMDKRLEIEDVLTDFTLPGEQEGEKVFVVCRKKEQK